MNRSAEENKKKLDQAIHALEAYTGSIEFFDRAQAIQILFNELSPLHPNEREIAWTSFQKQWSKHNEALKLYAGPYREKVGEYLETIKTHLNTLQLATSSETEITKESFNDVHNSFKALEEYLGSGLLLSKEDKKTYWNQIRDLKEELKNCRTTIFEQHLELAQNELNQAREIIESTPPNQAIKVYKERQKKVLNLYLDRAQKDKLAREFQTLWTRLQERFDEFKSQRAEQQKQYHQEQIERLGRMEFALERLENNMTKKKENLLNNQKRLRDEYKAENIDRIRSWMKEDQQAIKDMEASHQDLLKKIERLKERLSTFKHS